MLMPATHAPETGNRNLHEKFDVSSSQFLAPEQLSDQSRWTVCVTCRTVSVIEWNGAAFYSVQETGTGKTSTGLTDTRARFLVPDDW